MRKAWIACQQSGVNPNGHFVVVPEMVKIGSGAERQIDNIKMSRYACYLTVQNASPEKKIVAQAQTYFAIQTRRAEQLLDKPFTEEEEKRLLLRSEMKKHNNHLASAAKEAGVITNKDYGIITEKQSGRTKTREVRPKYELLTSHVARRTFVTMCLRKSMSPEDIRAVTGHTTADMMMMKYVKFDDESKREKMSILNEGTQLGVETVFDHAITDAERIRLLLPAKEAYFEIFEGDTASVNAHLAVLAHIRGSLEARAEYIKRLPADKLNEVLEIITKL